MIDSFCTTDPTGRKLLSLVEQYPAAGDPAVRVPPSVRTAREAVAWTFGFETSDDYALAVES